MFPARPLRLPTTTWLTPTPDPQSETQQGMGMMGGYGGQGGMMQDPRMMQMYSMMMQVRQTLRPHPASRNPES